MDVVLRKALHSNLVICAIAYLHNLLCISYLNCHIKTESTELIFTTADVQTMLLYYNNEFVTVRINQNS